MTSAASTHPASTLGTRATVTPYLVVHDGAAAIDFYKQAFGATEWGRLTEPDGKIGHAELRIGESRIMLAGEYPDYGALSPKTVGGTSVKLALHVPDVDAFVAQAVTAGLEVIEPIEDKFYGERGGRFEDPFGHIWLISTITEDLTPEEMQRRMNAM